MDIIGIFGLVFVMWLMIIVVSFFLIVVIAPLHISVFHNTTDRYITSAIQGYICNRNCYSTNKFVGQNERKIFEE